MATSKRSKSIVTEAASGSGAVVADAGSPESAAKRQPPLLQKSSGASLLDASTPPDTSNATKADVLPKLCRKSSSLQDVMTGTNGSSAKGDNKEKRRHSEVKAKKKSARQQRRATGWSTPTSASGSGLPQLNTGSSQQVVQSNFNSTNQLPGGRAKRAKRAGDIELVRPATINVVVKYQLGQYELKKFKACFKQIDLDASGVIDYDEFFEFIDETKTPFSEGLFRMIDADSNGTIDYEEFVHAMVLYCMYTRDEILQFAFDTFDPAKTGSIGEKEFKRLISVVNDGKPVFPGNFKNALSEFDRNKDGLLDFEEFKIMNKRYPMLLFPCFRLQDRMQKSTLGESHWLQLHKRLYQKLKQEKYQRKHNGTLPALSLVGTIRRFFHLDALDVYQP
uniref:EF-hand domain-containing protein n=1 Tax=Globisporangium ultimum (strain ATCC 200006 / CBS 805.95 / DAOM BR144) TaxID=431595 RepID=K3WVM9_GLOUD